MVSINEKSKLIKIIQKEHFIEEDKDELRHILSKLPSEVLKSLLGKIYEQFIKNYVKISASRESTTEIVNSENEQKAIKKTHSSFPLNVPNFKEKTMNELRRLVLLLEATVSQKKLILEEAESILDKHITRATKGEISIPKTANLKVIAGTIIYTIIFFSENMPKIMLKEIANILNMDSAYISRYYGIHFKQLYPKIDTKKSYDEYRKELEPLVRIKKGKILGFCLIFCEIP